MALKLDMRIIPPNFETIPLALKERPQWVLWNSRERTDRSGETFLSKEPVSANNRNISWKDKKNWKSFEQVKQEYEQGGFNGIGFVLSEDTPLLCVDLDNIEDLSKMGAELHYLTNHSYTEVSPSGTGLHIWFKGTKPEGFTGTKKGNVEIFGGQDKFVTVTGEVFEADQGGTTTVEAKPEVIQLIADKYFTKPTQKKSPNLNDEGNSSVKLSDGQIVELIQRYKPKSFKVYQGDISNYASQSDAVMALMNDLAFYTAKDVEQMARIYNSSSVTYSDEAENNRKLRYTIEKAIAGTQNVYTPKAPKHSLTKNNGINQDERKNSVEVLPMPNNGTMHYADVISMLEMDDKGNVKKSAFNVQQILESRIFHRVLAFDTFRQREVIGRDLPWRKREFPNKKYEQWKSSDDAQLRHFLAYSFGIKGKDLIMDALVNTFQKRSFHPVKIYIKTVPWDKQQRVETFFIDYLGAADTPYTRSVARKWFTAAVKRIYEPGCKFDYMPVLVGEQGVGKSTAIQKLAPDFFNDSLRNFDVKESGEVLQSSWIIEIGELAAMKKSEEEEMKGFLSRQVDIFRPAYARSAQEFPRHVVFMGTTNNYQFLKDTTGNRRFLPIQVSKERKYTPWNDLDEMTVAQLWAEAYELYAAGESVDLEDEIKEAAKIIQAEYTERDEREGIIESYLEMLLPTNWETMSILERRQFFQDGRQGSIEREFVCVSEVWRECLGYLETPSRIESNKIIGILSKLGWKPKAPSIKRFKHYERQRAFIKE